MKSALRVMGLLLLAVLALQLYFVVRVAVMAIMAPESTSFERSQAWQFVSQKGRLPWQQQWVPYAQISDNLKRAVIASEDDGFSSHGGVDWDAINKAWDKNARAEQRAAARKPTAPQAAANAKLPKPPKIIGGSTITQQLAKNLFFAGERTLLRKGQELVVTLLLEQFLSKERILEIYLNHVEWGTGVFGAEAAAQHYFRKPASKLNVYEAARLAVMLPRPRYFEKLPNSAYVAGRAGVIVGRMGDAQLP
ncbi:MAG: transglycosylase domain-containing protein [Candidatus Saccharibacteria bacterium]|nr:transglycosylase domain-containing protein [Rhodoferax sp.]